MKQIVDYILVGQGLSGSILAMELIKRGKTILVFEPGKSNSASNVAIGLVNPITGKRLVKSWLIDDLIPTAIKTYQDYEQQFSKSFLQFSDIARVIPNQDIFEQWQPNFQQAVKEGYISSMIEEYSIESESWSYFTIQKTFYLRTALLLKCIREYLKVKESLFEDLFEIDKIQQTTDSIQYKNFECKKVIFCEGAQARFNPYFETLPWNVNKGEVIDIKIEDYNFKKILKKNIFVVNEKTHCRVGATYDRENINEELTQSALHYFDERLKLILESPYEVVKHQAAIRPATRDRRPFLGCSSKANNIMIFNGFGAKGVSLIPYFSKQFCNFLLFGKPFDTAANISRFA